MKRWIAWSVFLSGVVVLWRGLGPQRKAAALVPRELRSPLVYLPMSVTNRLTLSLLRLGTRLPSPVADGVRMEKTVLRSQGDGGHVPGVVYEPDGRSRPSGALVWIHGGGLIAGTPAQAHAVCSRLAHALGIYVLSVDYRLAPEHPFPAGLEDCYSALSWLHGAAESLGIDPDRIAVGGESAGGGLAAALCQLARDRQGPPIAFQVLVYPMLDDRTAARSDHDGRGAFVWRPESNRYGWTSYLGHEPGADEARPHAVPGRCEDLAGLPPAWIGVGERDLFYEEDVDYAQRLHTAGVSCQLVIEAEMYHGADLLAPRAPAMREFRASATDALAAALCADRTGQVQRGVGT